MNTRQRPKSAPTRAQRRRLERPALLRRQRPRRKQRKPKKRRKQRTHREQARPLSANGKLAAAKNGERLQNRRLNPKPRASRTRSVELDIKSNRRCSLCAHGLYASHLLSGRPCPVSSGAISESGSRFQIGC